VPAISTGDIFRANIKGGTPLGRTVQEYTSRGALVPDSVTNDMVRDRLAQDDVTEGFLLDGYPRNVAQVDELDVILPTPADARPRGGDHGGPGHRGRAAAEAREIEGRDGRHRGRHPAPARRLRRETAPIARVYAERGLLVQVDGIGDVTRSPSVLVAAIGATTGR
jgi:adenylate kinase